LIKPYELTDAAIHYNLNPKTFIVMKSTNPPKFDYIHSLNKCNFIDAWSKYLKEKDEVFISAKVMYRELKSAGKLFEFGRYVEDAGLYKGRSFAIGIKHALYSSRDGINYHPSFIKIKKTIKLYGKYNPI